jgi:hypothetical protein
MKMKQLGRDQRKRRVALGFGVVLLVAVLGQSGARADTINLTGIGASAINGDLQGTHFFTTEQQPTGTGVIKPFLTIQRKGTEQGYNSDASIKDLQFDQKRSGDQGDKGWTRSLLISDLLPVSLAGQSGSYIKFLLDVDEPNGQSTAKLSLDVLQLFVTNDQKLTGYTGYGDSVHAGDFTIGKSTDGFGTKATKVYDLDGKKDFTVEYYDRSHGSGSGDIYVYIPYQVLAGRTEKYLTLYSSFGVPSTSEGGFEEWSAATRSVAAPPPSVPLPPVASGGLVLVCVAIGLGHWSQRRRSNTTPA